MIVNIERLRIYPKIQLMILSCLDLSDISRDLARRGCIKKVLVSIHFTITCSHIIYYLNAQTNGKGRGGGS